MWGRVLAFTHRASKEQQETAKKWLEYIGHPSKLLNIPQVKVEEYIEEWDLIITFGTLPYIAVEQALKKKGVNPYRLEKLPGLRQLEKNPENIEDRATTVQQLTNIGKDITENSFFPKNITVRKEQLPELDEYQTSLAMKVSEEQKVSRTLLLSREDKIIQIGGTRRESTDVYLTPLELILLSHAMKVFGTEEVRLLEEKKNES